MMQQSEGCVHAVGVRYTDEGLNLLRPDELECPRNDDDGGVGVNRASGFIVNFPKLIPLVDLDLFHLNGGRSNEV